MKQKSFCRAKLLITHTGIQEFLYQNFMHLVKKRKVSYRVFEKYCPILLFARVFIIFAVVVNRVEGDSAWGYCTRVKFNEYTVT